MAITKFDRANLKALRADIDAALATVAEKHGISLGIGNISFSGEKFTTRMTAMTVASPTTLKVVAHNPELAAFAGTADAGDDVTTLKLVVSRPADGRPAPFGDHHRWSQAYRKHHASFGLQADDLGATIPWRGKAMRIGGITLNSPRGNVILATMGDNPRYTVVQAADVLAAMGR